MDAPEAGTERASRSVARAVGFAAAIGLVAGLIVGWIVAETRPDTFITSSTYAIVPQARTVEEGIAVGAEPGQLALLTSVVSSMATDPDTIETIEQALGRDPGVVFAPTLIADSPLVFQVQVRGETPEWAVEAAHAMERSLPSVDKARTLLNDSRANLIVTSSAQMPELDHLIPSVLIVLGSGLTGSLVAAGAALGYGRYVRRI